MNLKLGLRCDKNKDFAYARTADYWNRRARQALETAESGGYSSH
jgi:hypothetical protein